MIDIIAITSTRVVDLVVCARHTQQRERKTKLLFMYMENHKIIKVNNHIDDKILIIFALHNNINETVKP